MSKRRDYRELPPLELDAELDRKVREMTTIADQDVAETRVNFRWGVPQLATVKRAAATMGVPYQSYIKQVLIRQALADLQMAQRVRQHNTQQVERDRR